LQAFVFHGNSRRAKVFLQSVKDKLLSAQLRAYSKINLELVGFYWGLGKEIIEQQEIKKWGSKFLAQLSHDLQNAFPGMKGFSKRNLEYMRLFSMTYDNVDLTQQPVAQLPWSHIVLLLNKFKNDSNHRNWYTKESISNGWSRAILHLQIKNKLYERQASNKIKISNYQKLLPAPQSDLANEMLTPIILIF